MVYEVEIYVNLLIDGRKKRFQTMLVTRKDVIVSLIDNFEEYILTSKFCWS